MSRSFKKEAIIKDGSRKNNFYNKRLRRVVKPFVKKAAIEDNQFHDILDIIEIWDYDDNKPYMPQLDKTAQDVIIPNTHEVTNDYNVCDWRSRWTKQQLDKMSGREKRGIIGK